MRESRTYGSVRGAGSNLRPYRDRLRRYSKSAAIPGTPVTALNAERDNQAYGRTGGPNVQFCTHRDDRWGRVDRRACRVIA
jgi:hypothetical protein